MLIFNTKRFLISFLNFVKKNGSSGNKMKLTYKIILKVASRQTLFSQNKLPQYVVSY